MFTRLWELTRRFQTTNVIFALLCIYYSVLLLPLLQSLYVLFYHVSLLLQVPYETLNKRFRAAQKNIDRETSHVTMVVAELEKTLSSFPVVDSVVSLLDGVVEKLSALKRKVRSPAVLYTRTQP